MWISTSDIAIFLLIFLMATVQPVFKHFPSWTDPQAPKPRLQGIPLLQMSSQFLRTVDFLGSIDNKKLFIFCLRYMILNKSVMVPKISELFSIMDVNYEFLHLAIFPSIQLIALEKISANKLNYPINQSPYLDFFLSLNNPNLLQQFLSSVLIIIINMDGLLYCSGRWDDSFCIAKLIEAIFSAVLLLIILIQVLADILHQGRFVFGFIQVIQALMFFTLVYNIVYSLDHSLDILYYLESLFYDWYFCTLVFYVTYKILEKSEANKDKIKYLKAIYVILILVFVVAFIISITLSIRQCQQIWFVAIDSVGLLICIGLVYAGRKHHNQQIQKLYDFKNQKQIKNPLSRMWILILINIFCQVIQLVQSLIFLIQTDLSCKFTEDYTVDRIIKLIFSLFSLHLSFACTLVIFEMKRRGQKAYQKKIDRSYSISSQKSNGLQLLDFNRSLTQTEHQKYEQNQL